MFFLELTFDRVVVATMHSDTCPVAYIRGKCRVFHRDRLPCDLDAYKKEAHSFYYHQVLGPSRLICKSVIDRFFDKLYDRYLHRYFDVIPTALVKNAPGAFFSATLLNNDQHSQLPC